MRVSTNRRAALSAAVMAALVSSSGVMAASSTFDGGAAVGTVGDNITWGNAANWTTGGVADTLPSNVTPGDDLLFGGGTAGAIIDLGSSRFVNSLTFNKGYTLGLSATANVLTNTTGTITLAGGATPTINAIIAGANGLSLTGGGTLTLNRANGSTFTGNVTIDGAGTTLAFIGNGNAEQTALGAGAKSVTVSNGGTLSVISADSDPNTTNTKTFTVGAGGGTFDVQATRTFLLNDASQFAGTGSLTKAGAGVLSIGAAYTYTGAAINVNAGTLRVTNGGGIGATNTPITVASGAAFDIQATLAGTKPVTVGGTGVANNGALIADGGTGVVNGGVTLTADTSIGGAGTLQLTGVVTDGANTFNLTKVGGGTAILGAINDYGGNTTIAGGALRGTFGSSIPATGNLVLAGGALETGGSLAATLGAAPGQVQFTPATAGGFSAAIAGGLTVSVNGAATQLVWGSTANFNPSALILSGASAQGPLNFLNPIDLNGATRTFNANAPTAAATLGGPITGAGGLTKTGAGLLVLGNAGNSYNGATTVNGGTLRGTLGTTIPFNGNLALNGGALETGVNVTAALGTGAGQIQLAGGASGFSAFGAPVTVNLGGSGASLQFTGGGTFNPSTLVLNTLSADNTITLQNPVDFNGGSRTIQVNASTANLAGGITNSTGTAGLTKTGAGTLVLSSANSYNGTTSLSGGTLSISAGNNLGAAGGALNFNGGTLRVTGTALNNLTGRAVTFANNTATAIEVADPANAFALPNAMSIGTGDFTKSGPGTLVLTGANSVRTLNANAGTIDIGAGSLTLNNGGGNTIRGTGNATINGGGTLNISGQAGAFGDNSVSTGVTLTINAKVSVVTAGGGFEYCCDNPGGTIVLTNPANDYTGGILYSAAGTISVPSIGNATANSPLGTGSVINFNSSGARLLYTGTGETTDKVFTVNANAILDQSGPGGTLNVSGVIAGGTGARTLTLQGSTSGIGQLSGGLPAGLAITKVGTGTWILSGPSASAAAVAVNGGTLLVNNTTGSATGTSPVTVASGGTLGGSGIITGAVSISGTGVLSPGNSPGILSTGALTMAAGTDLLIELLGTAAGTAHDQVNVTGTVNLTGADLIIAAIGPISVGDQFTIINNDAADLVTGTFANGATVAGPNGSQFAINYIGGSGNDVVLTTTAVPEPTALGAVAIAAAGLLGRRRRRSA